MYRQIEITAFLELKLAIEKTKMICRDIFKIIFKNQRLQFLRRKSERSTYTTIVDSLLQMHSASVTSYPSGVSNRIPSFPDDTKNQNNSTLEACLNQMPAIQRSAFVYKTFEDKKTSLICTDLNINEAVFWSLIHNARKELVESLDLN